MPKRRTPPKKVNPARKRREFERAYGSKERVAWVQSRVCNVCSDVPCENAHYMTGGMGRKADFTTIVPLCAPHHRMLHRMGIASFESYLLTNLKALAELTERDWQAFRAEGAA